MSAPEQHLGPQDVYEPELLDTLERRLSERPVLLVGPVGSGSRQIARVVVQQAEMHVILNPGTAGGDYEALVADALRQIVRQIVTKTVEQLGVEPLEISQLNEDTPRADQVRLHLANRFGPDTEAVIAISQGAPAAEWYLERALTALPSGSRLVLLEAHRLTPEPALWELRQLANDGGLQILFSTRPSHVAQLTGSDSALYGDVWTVELTPPPINRWAKVLSAHGHPLHPDDLEWLIGRTRGRPATTIGVLDRQNKSTSIKTAWHQAVRANIARADDVRRLAGAVHPYAPRLLQAIARGEAPYGAIEDAPSQRIARALTRLRDLDLIEQPQPRRWEIADPLLAAALALRSPPRVPDPPARPVHL